MVFGQNSKEKKDLQQGSMGSIHIIIMKSYSLEPQRVPQPENLPYTWKAIIFLIKLLMCRVRVCRLMEIFHHY